MLERVAILIAFILRVSTMEFRATNVGPANIYIFSTLWLIPFLEYKYRK